MKLLPISHKPTEATQFFQDHGHSPQLWWSKCNWRLTVTGRSPDTKWGQNPVFANNSWQNGEAQAVPNDLVRQPACNDMPIGLLRSWPDLDLTLAWPELRSDFEINLPRSKVNISNRLDEPNTMVSLFLLSFISYHTCYQFKTIFVENYNFSFDDLWRLNCWPKVKSDRQALLGHE